MKWLTVYPHMGCNSFCVYCTSRAIDDQLVAKRQALGLATPVAPRRRFTSRLLERIQAHPEPHEKENVVKPAEDLTSDEATRVIQERRQRGYSALRFEGGEPTLWEPLVSVIGSARKWGYERIEVISNGRRLADPGYAETFLTSGVTHVVLSLLGVDAPTHDGISLVAGSFAELTQAFRNCVRIRDNARTKLHLSANIITTAETFRSLPRQIEWLASLGILAGEVRLVRFSFLGDDATLRHRLAFPIEQLRGPLLEAQQVAAKLKFTLQTDEIPLCQHEPVTSQLLAQALNRFGQHPGGGSNAGGSELLPAGAVKSALCQKCVVAPACPRVRAEFLPAGAEGVYRPIGEDMFSRQLASATDPAARDDAAKSIRHLVEWGLVGADTKDGAQQKLNAFYVTQLKTAVAAGAELDAIGALYGLLKLERPAGYKPSGFVDRLKADPTNLRKAAVVPTPEGIGHNDPTQLPLERHLLTFAHGFSVLLLGRTGGDHEVTLAEVRTADAPAGADPLVHAVFTEHVLEVVDSARRLRLVKGQLEGERDGQWRPLILASSPDLIRLQAVGREPAPEPPERSNRDGDNDEGGEHPETETSDFRPRPAFLPELKAAIEGAAEFDAVRALHGLLGLDPIREYQPVGFMNRLGPASLSARRVADRSTTQASGTPREFRLVFAEDFALRIVGRGTTDGEVQVVELRASEPPAGADPLVYSLFVEHMLVVLDGARSLRLVGSQLDGDRNGNWVRLLKAATPELLRLELLPEQAGSSQPTAA